MRYLGIDFGLRYIGIASSDEEGIFALPERVLQQPVHAVEEIRNIAEQKKSAAIVIGESKDFNGNDNPIMPQLLKFKADLETSTGLPVYLEPEFLTSHQAAKLQDVTAENTIHASAAALILQSFLDRQKNQRLDPESEELNQRWQKDRP